MKNKTHPYYRKRYHAFCFVLVAIIIAIIVANILSEGTTYKTQSIYGVIFLIAAIFLYNPILGLIIKCPHCRSRLKMLKHLEDISSKAKCDSCKVIWNLEVAFKTNRNDDFDNHDYD